MPTITITITADAEVTVATKGFAGAACKAATRELEAGLGATSSDTPTAEMRATVSAPLKARS